MRAFVGVVAGIVLLSLGGILFPFAGDGDAMLLLMTGGIVAVIAGLVTADLSLRHLLNATAKRWLSDPRHGRPSATGGADSTARAVRERRFSTVPRGYDPAEMIAYLMALADEAERLQSR